MNRGQGAAENHYPTMSIQEICRLPVAELAAKDCALFLWVTFPQLQDAMKLFEAWGFTYKTLGFAWVKQIRKRILFRDGLLDTFQCGNLSAWD